MKRKIAIIGGGAAGMICATTILESYNNSDLEVHIFDKNPKIGVKVAITGGGRCNVTTGEKDPAKILSKYISGKIFLKASLAAFTPQNLIEWFSKHKLPLKTEADNRVFPISNKGSDVVKVFEEIIFNNKIAQLHLLETVKQVSIATSFPNTFKLVTSKDEYEFNYLVILTGGKAYQQTGSVGDGYEFAKSLKHKITKLGQSLNSFATAENWGHELSGISLPEVQITAYLQNQRKITVNGSMIFTHFGISGPAVFTLASQLAFVEISLDNPVRILLKPFISENYDSIKNKFLQNIDSDPQQTPQMLISKFVPKRLAEKIIILADIPAKNIANIPIDKRNHLINLLNQGFELNIIGRRSGAEFVTAGGIDLSQIDRKTMESKIVPHLYFAGEVLDIDGLTGEYNLQAAWSTGRAAGKHIVKDLTLN